jgi:hypothetical protein
MKLPAPTAVMLLSETTRQQRAATAPGNNKYNTFSFPNGKTNEGQQQLPFLLPMGV